MQNLSHPNVIRYLDAMRTRNHLYIVLEYMAHGALANLKGELSEPEVALYIAQTLRGLQYLHLQGIIHRDIKVGDYSFTSLQLFVVLFVTASG
jgi:serine/threonine protein kinase